MMRHPVEERNRTVPRLPIPNRLFFYTCGFATDCFNYVAILAEAFFAHKVLHATEFEMGLLGAAGALGYTLPCIYTGLWSERFGRRRLCLIATAGQLIAYLAAPHATAVGWLCGISFFRSLATSFYWPPLMAWMGETTTRGALSGVVGGYNVSWAMGILVGFGSCGVLFEHVSPRAPFFAAAGLAAITFVFIALCTPRCANLENHDHDLTPNDVRSFVRQGLSLNCLGYFLSALVLYLFPKVAGDQLGEAQQGLLQATRMVGQVLLFFLLTHTTVWHFRRWPVLLCLVMYGLSVLGVSLSHQYSVYLASFFLMGCGCGMSYTLSAYYVLALSKSKGFGTGVQEALIGTGNLLGPLFGGTVATLATPRGAVAATLVPIALVTVLVRTRGRNRSST